MINLHEKFYNLTADPFRLSSDYRFSFAHESFTNAISYLKFAIYSEEGFIVITGRPGTGKTTLINQVISELDPGKYQIAHLVTTQYESHDLLNMIAASFDLDMGEASKSSILLALEKFLRRKQAEGKRVLLIVDEAQGLKKDSVEELRQLSNLNIDGKPLLQIFLVGQEEFRDIIESADMEQLRQRVVASSHMVPLTEAETVDYVTHRLKHAGWKGNPAITRGAVVMVHHFSGGIPRIINMICGRLLFHGYVEKKHELDIEDIKSVLDELSGELLVFNDQASFAELLDKMEVAGNEYLSPDVEEGSPVEQIETEAAEIREESVEAAENNKDVTSARNRTDDSQAVEELRYTGGAVSVMSGNTVRKVDIPAWDIHRDLLPKAENQNQNNDESNTPVDQSSDVSGSDLRSVVGDDDITLTNTAANPVPARSGSYSFSAYTVAAVVTGVIAVSLITVSLLKDEESSAPAVTVVVDDEARTEPSPDTGLEDQTATLILPAKDDLGRQAQQRKASATTIKPEFSGQAPVKVVGSNISDQSAMANARHRVAGQNKVTAVTATHEHVSSTLNTNTPSLLPEAKQNARIDVYQHGSNDFDAEKQRQYILEGGWVSRRDLVDFLPSDKVYCKDYVRFVSCWGVPEITTSEKGTFKQTFESRLAGFTDQGAFSVTTKHRIIKLPGNTGLPAQEEKPGFSVAETSFVKSKRCVFIDHNLISCSTENGQIERFSRIARN